MRLRLRACPKSVDPARDLVPFSAVKLDLDFWILDLFMFSLSVLFKLERKLRRLTRVFALEKVSL